MGAVAKVLAHCPDALDGASDAPVRGAGDEQRHEGRRQPRLEARRRGDHGRAGDAEGLRSLCGFWYLDSLAAFACSNACCCAPPTPSVKRVTAKRNILVFFAPDAVRAERDVYLPSYADADRLAFRHFGAEGRERVDDRESEFFTEFVASLGPRASSCVADFLFIDVGLLLNTDCASQRVNEDGID
jgi:hypothetical protein